jgi:hypothetical protein
MNQHGRFWHKRFVEVIRGAKAGASGNPSISDGAQSR